MSTKNYSSSQRKFYRENAIATYKNIILYQFTSFLVDSITARRFMRIFVYVLYTGSRKKVYPISNYYISKTIKVTKILKILYCL